MRAVVQRVSRARVTVAGRLTGEIGPGLAALIGVHVDDADANAERMAKKLLNLRVLADADGKLNLSLLDLHSKGVGLLLVPNFTVYGDATKNRRPSFIQSAGFEEGKRLFDVLVAHASERLDRVGTGEFGADMAVELINDGPVTLIVDA